MNLPPNWWAGKKGAETDDGQGSTSTPFRSPLDAVRPHLDQIVREGHVAHTRDGLEGEREHLITHPVIVDGQRKIATVIARACRAGRVFSASERGPGREAGGPFPLRQLVPGSG